MPQTFVLPKQVVIDPLTGAPSPGAKAYFYETTTSTPKPAYSDAGLTTPITQPVTADSAGALPVIYLSPLGQYKVTLNRSNDTLLYTADPLSFITQANLTAIGILSTGVKYDQTTAEATALVTPTNYYIDPKFYDFFRYNAVNNADCTLPLQKSVAVINTSRGLGTTGITETGGTIILPVINALISGNIQVPAQIHIQGQHKFGGATENNSKGTVLYTLSGAFGPVLTMQTPSTVDGVAFESFAGYGGVAVLFNDYFASPADNTQAFVARLTNCSSAGFNTFCKLLGFGGLHIDHCYGEGFGSTAIALGDAAVTPFAMGHIWIDHNILNSIGGYTSTKCIGLAAGFGVNDCVIEHNLFATWTNNNTTIIDLTGGTGNGAIRICDNTFDTVNGTGSICINISNADGVIIENNFFNGVRNCIKLRNCTNVRLGYNKQAAISGTYLDIDSTVTFAANTGTFTPAISFGGGTTGITYSEQTGTYQIDGEYIEMQVRLALTNKGSSTGVARNTGVPFTIRNDNASYAACGIVNYNNMSGITGMIIVGGEPNTTGLLLYMGGATDVAQLGNTQFTNTSILQFNARFKR